MPLFRDLLSLANTWSLAQTFTTQILAQVAGNAARFINTNDGASSQVARFEGDRATPAANDTMYASYYLSNASGTQTEAFRQSVRFTSVTAGAETTQVFWATTVSGVMADRLLLSSTVFCPVTDGLLGLGATTLRWSAVHLKPTTVATLPSGVAGSIAFASDGRKNGEGAGAGTGVLCFHDGTAWRACDTGATAAA